MNHWLVLFIVTCVLLLFIVILLIASNPYDVAESGSKQYMYRIVYAFGETNTLTVLSTIYSTFLFFAEGLLNTCFVPPPLFWNFRFTGLVWAHGLSNWREGGGGGRMKGGDRGGERIG